MLVDIVDAVDANFTAFFITPHNLRNGKKEVEGFAVALRKGLKVQAILEQPLNYNLKYKNIEDKICQLFKSFFLLNVCVIEEQR